MNFWDIVLQLVLLLWVAIALGIFFEKLGQNAILGYLTAGTLLGPDALHWIENDHFVSAASEIGVALLLFTIGLEFSWKRLRSLGGIAIGGGILQVTLTWSIAGLIVKMGGLDTKAAIALGAMISMGSTACVLRVLMDRAELDSVHGRIALGISLLQDIAVVPMVLIVTSLSLRGSAGQVLFSLGASAGMAVVLTLAFYGTANYILPRLLNLSNLAKNRELPILIAIATCIGSAWMAHALHLSPALGAFVAGMLLAESPFATQIRADVGALRILFVTLFFASVGMLADLSWLIHHIPAVLLSTLIIILGKTIILWSIVRRFGYPHGHSVAVGICLSQVGEFSIVLAQIALSGNILSTDHFQQLVSVILITMFATPFLVASATSLGSQTERLFKRSTTMLSEAKNASTIHAESLRNHVIVVGLGPAGEQVTDALQKNNVPFVVTELNPNAIMTHDFRDQIYIGDATQSQILSHLKTESARAVVITLPDHRTAQNIIAQVKAMAPQALVVVRARYHRHAWELEQAGADITIDEEQQLGRLLGEALIKAIPPTQ